MSKGSKLDAIHTPATEVIVNSAIELWVWFTLGLVAIISFLGRRVIKRWDYVLNSHMPANEIKELIKKSNTAVESNQKVLMDSNKEIHARMDNLYELLLRRAAHSTEHYRHTQNKE